MSCNELGLTECGLRVSKSADCEIVLRFPTSVDLTGYAGVFAIKAALDDASAELEVTETPTAATSVLVFDDRLATIRLKKADLATLPDATDPAEPWEAWCELVVTDPAGLTSRLFQKPFIAERGAAE